MWDDDDYVTANVALRSLDGLRRLWFEPGVTPQYYPVTFTSFWVEWQLWGDWAPGFHLTNVLLHAANAVLVWRVLVALDVPGAWIAAALFAVHPVHVESVAWVTERKNVLSGAFYLSAALVFLRRGPYAAVVALFVLALLSKSVTATLPVALAIALWWRDGRVRATDLWLLAPLVVLGVGSGLMTAAMERSRVGAVGTYWHQTFIERCLIAGRALWFYAGKLVLPWPIVFNYERWTIDARNIVEWTWPAAALAVGVAAWRAGRGPSAGLAFFAVTLAPALGFVNVYPMRYSFVADHFQYLASVGVLALLGAGLARWGLAAAAPVALVLAGMTGWQCRAYADVATLWTDTLAKNPRSVLALQNLGTIEYGRRNFPGALALYERARAVEPGQPDVWNSIGLAQAQAGDRDGAIASFETALRYDPKHAEAARNLGTVLAAAGRREEAIAAYERAIAASPGMTDAREDVAVLLGKAGRTTEAEAQLREAIRRAPASVRARIQLGEVLRAAGRGPDAVVAYEEAARLTPRSVEVWAGLAESHEGVGAHARAIAAAERARDLAASDGRRATAAEIERRIVEYRSHATGDASR